MRDDRVRIYRVDTVTVRANDATPPFAQLSTDGATFHIEIRPVVARWLRTVAIAGIPCFFVALAAEGILVTVARVARPPWNVLAVTGAVIVALLLVGLFMFGMFWLTLQSLRRRVSFDGQHLLLAGPDGFVMIPIADVRRISSATLPARRLDIDPSRSPREMFRRVRPVVIQVDVPGGTLQLFRGGTPEEVAWLARELVERVPLTRPYDDVLADPGGSLVPVTSLHGRTRRALLVTGVLATLGFTLIPGWFIFKGLSSKHWPNVVGRVTHSLYEESSERNETHYKAEIKYAYRVGDGSFTGDDFGYGRTPSDECVKQFVQSHPPGSDVVIHYDPSKPARSVVITGIGPFEWMLPACGVLTFALTMPLLLHRPTREEERMMARYAQSGPVPRSIGAAGEERDVITWTISAERSRHSRRRAVTTVFWMWVRVTLLTAAAVLLARRWLEPVLPTLPWTKLGWIMAIVPAPILLLPLASLVLPIAPPTYRISSVGVVSPRSKNPLIKWDRLDSFTLEPDPVIVDLCDVVLHRKDGVGRPVPLPEGGERARVLEALGRRLPNRPPLPRHAPVTLRDWIGGALLTAAFVVIVGRQMLSHLHAIRRADAGQLVFLAMMFVGPGIPVALFLRGRRASAQIFSLALKLNLFGAMGVMTYVVIHRALDSLR